MAWFALIIYAAAGLVAGFLGGLLGIGGGLIVVPALVWTFQLLGFPADRLMHLAVGTSLAAMVFTAAVSAYTHLMKKGINWHFFAGLAPGIVVGCVGSALIAENLSSKILEVIFGSFECLIGFYFIFFRPKEREGPVKDISWFILAIIGIGIGALSTIMGIGGGIITVPILVAFCLPMKNSIATSASTGFLIAVIGAISFLLMGGEAKAVEGSIGYVYLPAFALIAITAMVTAPFGARLAYVWPTLVLRRIFGVMLVIAGLVMLF